MQRISKFDTEDGLEREYNYLASIFLSWNRLLSLRGYLCCKKHKIEWGEFSDRGKGLGSLESLYNKAMLWLFETFLKAYN